MSRVDNAHQGSFDTQVPLDEGSDGCPGLFERRATKLLIDTIHAPPNF